ncbi:hypothetical protein, partial [Mangrovimonas sp. ST2L15]|uniref:hypothetical protein n=1 Tax=Mangrovimonas sp. ST2L15 TaxID=1645916 RepID=UPI000B1BB7B9
VSDFADASVSFDNFEIVEIPSCPQPTSLTVELVDMTTAIVEWTEYGTATSWNIEIVNVDLGETPAGVSPRSTFTISIFHEVAVPYSVHSTIAVVISTNSTVNEVGCGQDGISTISKLSKLTLASAKSET